MTADSGPIEDVAAFYDALAADYTALFRDWDAAVVRQGEIVDRLVRAAIPTPGEPGATALLDATCGIGTQAIGLALRGYRVTATDLSELSIARGRREAARLGAVVEFAVADVRALPDAFAERFDIAISFDNALPHLTDAADLVIAFDNLRRSLRRGGLLVVSVRDYDRLLADRPSGEPPRLSGPAGDRRVVVQVWDWEDDTPVYRLNQFVLIESAAGRWGVRHLETRYRAYRREELTTAARMAGLDGPEWLAPAETGYYQPILRARRP